MTLCPFLPAKRVGPAALGNDRSARVKGRESDDSHEMRFHDEDDVGHLVAEAAFPDLL